MSKSSSQSSPMTDFVRNSRCVRPHHPSSFLRLILVIPLLRSAFIWPIPVQKCLCKTRKTLKHTLVLFPEKLFAEQEQPCQERTTRKCEFRSKTTLISNSDFHCAGGVQFCDYLVDTNERTGPYIWEQMRTYLKHIKAYF